MQTAKEIISEVRQTESKEEKHLKQIISKTKQRMKNAEDDRLDRLINRDEFADIHNRLKDDLEQAHSGLLDIQKDHTKTISILNDVLALSEDIQQTYKDATPELKRKYLQLFFEKIEVDDGKIVGTTFTPVISQLIEIDRVRIRKQWRTMRSLIRTLILSNSQAISSLFATYKSLNSDLSNKIGFLI